MTALEKETVDIGSEKQMMHVLSFVYQELNMLSGLSDRLQAPIGDLLRNGDGPLSQSMYEIQGIDRLSQVIYDLTKFMKAVALETQPQWRIDISGAAQCLTLNELATRLHDQESAPEEDYDASAGGDCLFF